MSKLETINELWKYLKVRKKWWLLPLIITLLLLGALIIFTESSALAPLLYPFF